MQNKDSSQALKQVQGSCGSTRTIFLEDHYISCFRLYLGPTVLLYNPIFSHHRRHVLPGRGLSRAGLGRRGEGWLSGEAGSWTGRRQASPGPGRPEWGVSGKVRGSALGLGSKTLGARRPVDCHEETGTWTRQRWAKPL